VQPPGGDAAVVRVAGAGGKGLAFSVDVTPRYCAADPYEGGKQAVAECWRNLTAVGATPLALTDNLNFGNPERAEIMGEFVGAIRGIGEAARALDFPVVSGNVSLYNETLGEAIPPTPAIGGVGLIGDVATAIGIGFRRAGDVLLLVGGHGSHLGASIYLREILSRHDGAPPPVDLAEERRRGDFVRGLILAGRIRACHDLSDGGLAIAVAEMAMAGRMGATVKLEGPEHIVLFAEDQARYLLAIDPAVVREVLADAASAGIACVQIGIVGGDTLNLGTAASISVDLLRRQHEDWFPSFMNGRG